MAIPYGPSVLAAINVRDFQKAAAWYRDVLEMQPVYAIDDMGWGEFATALPGFTIGLQVDPEQAGNNGSCIVTLAVTDIEATKTTLESRGVQFDGDINVIEGMVKLATFRDPDGNAFMLSQSLGGAPGQ